MEPVWYDPTRHGDKYLLEAETLASPDKHTGCSWTQKLNDNNNNNKYNNANKNEFVFTFMFNRNLKSVT